MRRKVAPGTRNMKKRERRYQTGLEPPTVNSTDNNEEIRQCLWPSPESPQTVLASLPKWAFYDSGNGYVCTCPERLCPSLENTSGNDSGWVIKSLFAGPP